MQTFTNLEVALLFLTIGYGAVYGINNTLYRIGGMLGFGKTVQSDMGKVLDVIFYAAIGYLCYVYFGWNI